MQDLQDLQDSNNVQRPHFCFPNSFFATELEEDGGIQESATSFSDGLKKVLDDAGARPKLAATLNESVQGIPREMAVYERNKKLTKNLEKVHLALLNISPTSVSSERAFSVSGNFVVPGRASMKHSTLDNLCFLQAYYEAKD